MCRTLSKSPIFWQMSCSFRSSPLILSIRGSHDLDADLTGDVCLDPFGMVAALWHVCISQAATSLTRLPTKKQNYGTSVGTAARAQLWSFLTDKSDSVTRQPLLLACSQHAVSYGATQCKCLQDTASINLLTRDGTASIATRGQVLT